MAMSKEELEECVQLYFGCPLEMFLEILGSCLTDNLTVSGDPQVGPYTVSHTEVDGDLQQFVVNVVDLTDNGDGTGTIVVDGVECVFSKGGPTLKADNEDGTVTLTVGDVECVLQKGPLEYVEYDPALHTPGESVFDNGIPLPPPAAELEFVDFDPDVHVAGDPVDGEIPIPVKPTVREFASDDCDKRMRIYEDDASCPPASLISLKDMAVFIPRVIPEQLIFGGFWPTPGTDEDVPGSIDLASDSDLFGEAIPPPDPTCENAVIVHVKTQTSYKTPVQPGQFVYAQSAVDFPGWVETGDGINSAYGIVGSTTQAQTTPVAAPEDQIQDDSNHGDNRFIIPLDGTTLNWLEKYRTAGLEGNPNYVPGAASNLIYILGYTYVRT